MWYHEIDWGVIYWIFDESLRLTDQLSVSDQPIVGMWLTDKYYQ